MTPRSIQPRTATAFGCALLAAIVIACVLYWVVFALVMWEAVNCYRVTGNGSPCEVNTHSFEWAYIGSAVLGSIATFVLVFNLVRRRATAREPRVPPESTP